MQKLLFQLIMNHTEITVAVKTTKCTPKVNSVLVYGTETHMRSDKVTVILLKAYLHILIMPHNPSVMHCCKELWLSAQWLL